VIRYSGYLIKFNAKARVVKLVDALDLGSSELSSWGFESPLSHQEIQDFVRLVYTTCFVRPDESATLRQRFGRSHSIVAHKAKAPVKAQRAVNTNAG
jgi:hypothetical protein